MIFFLLWVLLLIFINFGWFKYLFKNGCNDLGIVVLNIVRWVFLLFNFVVIWLIFLMRLRLIIKLVLFIIKYDVKCVWR